MSIRESFQRNGSVGYATAAGLLIAAAAVAFIWSRDGGMPGRQTRGYFSDDDGKTFFVDSVERVPPFEHGGKIAYQAAVYRVGRNPPFVGYLQSFTEDGARQLRGLYSASPDGARDEQIAALRSSAALVKLPASEKWRPLADAGDVFNPRPPAGQTGPLESVYP